MSNQELTHEVPSALKQLARLVVRGFYTIEDALIIDMLVRNPCLKVSMPKKITEMMHKNQISSTKMIQNI